VKAPHFGLLNPQKKHQSQASKTVTIRPAKLPLGPHATKPLCGAHEKLQQMMCDFVDFFNWKLP